MSAANRLRVGLRRRATRARTQIYRAGERAMSFVRYTTIFVSLITLAIIGAAEENANPWFLFTVAAIVWLLGMVALAGIRYPGPVAGFLLGEKFTQLVGRGEDLASTVRAVTFRVAAVLLLPAAAAAWTSVVPIVDRPEVFGGLALVGIFSVLAVIASPATNLRWSLLGLAGVSLAGTSAWAYWDSGNSPVAWAIIGVAGLVVFGFIALEGDWVKTLVQLVVLGFLVGGLVYAGLQLNTNSPSDSPTMTIAATAAASSRTQCDEAFWEDHGDPANGYMWYEIEVEADNCVQFDLPDPGRWSNKRLLPADAATWFEVELLSSGDRGFIRCNDSSGPMEGNLSSFRLHDGSGTAVLWVWNSGLIEDPTVGQTCHM